MTSARLLTAGLVAALMPSLAALPAAPAAAQSRDLGRDHNRGGVDNDRLPARAGRDTALRAGPMGSYPEVRRIRQGETVQIHGCLNDRSWCDVGRGDDRGWVAAADIDAEQDGRHDTVVNLWGRLNIGGARFAIGDYWDDHYRQQPFYGERSRWEAQYFASHRDSWGPRPGARRWSVGGGRQLGVMRRRSWLFAGPDWRYPHVGILYPRASVSIIGCLRDWSWCDVAYRGNRGWVPASHMAGTWQGRRQAINLIAPVLGIGIRPFLFQAYWNEHYRGKPFYRERGRWEGQYRLNHRETWGPDLQVTPNPAGQPPRIDERAFPGAAVPDPVRSRGEPQPRLRGRPQAPAHDPSDARQQAHDRDQARPQRAPGTPDPAAAP